MAEERIAKPYAKSLFELADEAGSLDRVHEDLADIVKTIEASGELQDFLDNPVIGEDQANAVFDGLFGSKVEEITSRFLKFLNAKGRREIIPEIYEQFDKMFMKARKLEKAHVIAAREMTQDQLDRLKEKLEKQHQTQIQLSTEIRPELLGGFIVEIGDTVMNLSVKNQLENLRKNIINAS